MASTFTSFNNLEKFEARSVGWDHGDALDRIDQGITSGVHIVTASEDIAAYQMVRFNTATNNAVLIAHMSSSEGLADGIALESITSGSTGRILTRGIVSNVGWAWTRGDILYTGDSAGALVKRVPATPTHVANDGEKLLMQPVGIAINDTRAYFDMFRGRTLWPYQLTPDGYIVTSGTATPSIKSISGPGSIPVLTATTATVVFYYRLPAWFLGFSDTTNIWGFRIKYIATGGGSIDVSNVMDGAGTTGNPGVTAGTTTSWSTLEASWGQILDSGGTFTAGNVVGIEVTIAGASVDFQINPALRFEPMVSIFG